MTGQVVSAGECRTMAEVRRGVDAIDHALARLIGERMRYMEAAARIKSERELVRDEARKAEVLANARANAATNRIPAPLAEALWETLVEGSIAYEFEMFDAR